jgi:hypothetical protein
MSQHAIGGLFVGLMALLVAATVVAQAVSQRRRREDFIETYQSAGGILYTGIQFGCAGVLGIFGLGLLVLVALNPSR